MKYIIWICLFFSFKGFAQNYSASVNQAFTLTRMAEKFHVQPKSIDDVFSANLFHVFFDILDEHKLIFTKQDVQIVEQYRFLLDEEIKLKKQSFLQQVQLIANESIKRSAAIIDSIAKKPLNFEKEEYYHPAMDTVMPATQAELIAKIAKQFKYNILYRILSYAEDESHKVSTKWRDSLEIKIRNRSGNAWKRYLNNMLQYPGGLQVYIGNTYCNAIALCYDPHSAFFSKTQKENFIKEVGGKSFEFGFGLEEDEEGGLLINKLKPGSPAYKSGQLNHGDKIEEIQWQGSAPMDVRDASPEQIENILNTSNHDQLSLSVKKPDGTKVKVQLWKETTDNDEEDKVKSMLLKGTKTIGFISLPAFYTDWEDKQNNINGCANDIAKEIVKLKKENIQGLIIDVRFNGGGSMQEAADLIGLFIEGGPVAQLKTNESKIYTLKDVNRGTIYDGPLLILVNGYSASASEIFAAALQDYNRAIVVGSPTYGKATAQVILPLDTTIDIKTGNGSQLTDVFVKLTVEQIFRLNGSSTQARGVLPDIELPDLYQTATLETSEKFYIRNSNIEANKYYRPNPVLSLTDVKKKTQLITDTASVFKYIKATKEKYEKEANKPVSLKWSAALAAAKESAEAEENEEPEFLLTDYTPQPNQYEINRMKTDKSMEWMNKLWVERIKKDTHIQMAYYILSILN